MIKAKHNDQDIIIGQYTLGLLDRTENETVQQLLSADPAAARCALSWESNLLELVDALPSITPPHALLTQILTTLDLPLDPDDLMNERPLPAALPITLPEEPQPADDSPQVEANTTTFGDAQPTGKRLTKAVWFGGGVLGLLFVTVLVFALFPAKPTEPPITILEVAPTLGAVLQAPGQSSTPGWVVTIDPGGNVLLTPKVHTDAPSETSVQLWTYNKVLSQPRSLGLIDPNQPVAIPSTLIGEIGEDQYFEMTLEPQGGAPTSEPSGPVLFIGRVVTFGEK